MATVTRSEEYAKFAGMEDSVAVFAIGETTAEVPTNFTRIIGMSHVSVPGTGAYTTALEAPGIAEAITGTATGTSYGVVLGTATSFTATRVATASAATYLLCVRGVN